MIIPQLCREVTFCKIDTNIRPIINRMKRNNIQIYVSQESINQWTGYKIILILQTYKEITSFKLATNKPSQTN